MSWMASRRAEYHPDGPFVAKRNANVGNIEFVFGGIYTAKQLLEDANVSKRHIQRLYDTFWMDMAPEGAETGPLPVRPPEPVEQSPAPSGEPEIIVDPNLPPAEPVVEVVDTVAVAFKDIGFGRFVRVNAGGEKFGPFVKRAEAEQSQLPIEPKG